MQPKMGGKFHLKLNIGERPIANKYREGKMKRTLKRELKSTWNCWKGTVWSQSCLFVISFGFGQNALSNYAGQRQFERREKSLRNVAFGCYSLLLNTVSWTEARSKNLGRRASEGNHYQDSLLTWFCPTSQYVSLLICLGRWHNGFKWPVLKHGPRSLTYMRVFGWQTHMRNESEIRCQTFTGGSIGRLWRFNWRVWAEAYMLGPERWWTMPE